MKEICWTKILICLHFKFSWKHFLYLCISIIYCCNLCHFVYRDKYLKVAIMCKGKERAQNINILRFINVEGLKPKLDDPNFLEFIQDKETSILREAWKADTSKLNIERFWYYFQHKNSIRHSGEITILAKRNIWPQLKLIKNSEGSPCLRKEKSFFNLENNIFLCGANIPPKNTTQNIVSKTEYFGSGNSNYVKAYTRK